MPTLTYEAARKGPFFCLVVTWDDGTRLVIDESAHINAVGLGRAFERFAEEYAGPPKWAERRMNGQRLDANGEGH